MKLFRRWFGYRELKDEVDEIRARTDQLETMVKCKHENWAMIPIWFEGPTEGYVKKCSECGMTLAYLSREEGLKEELQKMEREIHRKRVGYNKILNKYMEGRQS